MEQKPASRKFSLTGRLFSRSKSKKSVDSVDFSAHQEELLTEPQVQCLRVTLQRHPSLGFGFSMRPGPDGKGATITQVIRDGPAAKKLKVHDFIVCLQAALCDDNSFEATRELIQQSGSMVKLNVIRPKVDDHGAAAVSDEDYGEYACLETFLQSIRASGLLDKLHSERLSSGNVLLEAEEGDGSGAAESKAADPRDVVAMGVALEEHKTEDANAQEDGYVDLVKHDMNKAVLQEVQVLSAARALSSAKVSVEEETAADKERKSKTKKSISTPPRGIAVQEADEDRVALGETSSGVSSARVSGESADIHPAPRSPDSKDGMPPAPPPRHLSPPSSGDSAELSHLDFSRTSRSVSPSPSSRHSSRSQYFFIGQADRETASALLSSKDNGSFVVRESLRNPGSYAISVKFGERVYHIEIVRDAEGYRISKSMAFPSILELVCYYETNKLSKHFSYLETMLVTRRGSIEFPVRIDSVFV